MAHLSNTRRKLAPRSEKKEACVWVWCLWGVFSRLLILFSQKAFARAAVLARSLFRIVCWDCFFLEGPHHACIATSALELGNGTTIKLQKKKKREGPHILVLWI